MKQQFKKPDIKQWRSTVCLPQLTAWESLQSSTQGGGTKREPIAFLSWERAESLGRSGQTKFIMEFQKGKTYMYIEREA